MHGMEGNGKPRFSLWMTIAFAFGGVALAAVLALVFGFLVMILWNWLMPAIFRLPAIDYWQGWGLVLLSHILIKPGFPHGGRGRGWGGWGGRRHHPDWKEHLARHMPPRNPPEEPTL